MALRKAAQKTAHLNKWTKLNKKQHVRFFVVYNKTDKVSGVGRSKTIPRQLDSITTRGIRYELKDFTPT